MTVWSLVTGIFSDTLDLLYTAWTSISFDGVSVLGLVLGIFSFGILVSVLRDVLGHASGVSPDKLDRSSWIDTTEPSSDTAVVPYFEPIWRS